MRRLLSRGLPAVLLVTALAVPPLSPASAAEPTVVSSVNFNDATLGTWSQSGNPTLSYVDVEGGKALRIGDTTKSWDGIQSPAGIFTPGKTYSFSMKAKLAEGGPDSADVRFVMKPNYNWIGTTTINAADWTTVSGTFDVPADAAASGLQVYLNVGGSGRDDLDPPQVISFLVDDISITTAGSADPGTPPGDVVPGGAVNPTTTPVSAAQGSGNVAALTFDDGPNGQTTADLLDYLKQKQIPATFCLIGDNIKQPGGAALVKRMVAEGHTLCNHSTGYGDMGSMSADAIRADLVENLRIIRQALGDPNAAVPFFRAPNGSWGNTPAVAVSLGMQPLAVTNTISDWNVSDQAQLTTNLRAAMKAGQIVLTHDGGGDRTASMAAVRTVVDERLDAGWSFTRPAGAPEPGQVPGTALIESTFEDGTLGGWTRRQASANDSPTVSVVDGGAAGTAHAALVSGRTHEGDGIQHDVTGLLLPGKSYRFEGAVRFAPGEATGEGLTLSMRTVSGEAGSEQISYANLIQVPDARADGWTTVSGTFTVPAYTLAAELYVEAKYNSKNTSSFLIDQIRVSVPEATSVDTSLKPIKSAVLFPVGVAIDSRETTGNASKLLLHHFNQITPENHMKVEAWYDSNGQFARHAEATTLLNYAAANHLRFYGHVLLWHSQTPDWFFRDGDRELTNSASDKQLLRDRLKVHIDNVARSISDDYGLFGSETNPLVAWDVVNEVISDQRTSDGLRPSRWYDVLGEEYIHLAFRYADKAFNETYAKPGTQRPVKLFINDYNTEQDAKGEQYHALVERLVQAHVPIDGVGHQFHVSLTTPVSALQNALTRFAGMGLMQEVTELDVTMNPASEANRIQQGYYYEKVFSALKAYHAGAPAAEKLFAATIWGLTDNRSWRDAQEPLAFDSAFQAKPAYWGIIGDDSGLPPLITTANVFGGELPLSASSFTDVSWSNLPTLPLTNEAGSFGLRWSDDHLTVLVRTRPEVSALAFTYGDKEYTYRAGDSASVPGIDRAANGGRQFIVRLPHSGIAAGGTAAFDVRVVGADGVIGGWNSPGSTGRLTFLEPLSYVSVPEASGPVTVDGQVDDLWQAAASAQTAHTVSGAADGATARVRTLWKGNSLFVLAEVTDSEIDLSNSDPWNRDSLEVFLDLGNEKTDAYGPNAMQLRIAANGELSFGSGNEAAQRARVAHSATALTDTGYNVELELNLIGQSGGQSNVPLGGAGTFHGIDFQINDGRGGERTSVHTWADPTGTGYQTTARWGVIRLADASTGPVDEAWATVDVRDGKLVAGGTLPVTVTGLTPGQQISAVLHSDPITVTGIPAADSAGRVSFTVRAPADLEPGPHTLVISSPGLSDIRVPITVVPADATTQPPASTGPAGKIATTGAQFPLGIAFAAAVLLTAGYLLKMGRRRGGRELGTK